MNAPVAEGLRLAVSRTSGGGAMTYPFAAIVGQEVMKRALLAVTVDPTIGGVLIMGDRGTGKSTAIRALAEVLPPIETVADCRYGCAPFPRGGLCHECREREELRSTHRTVPMVDMPLGAGEDRVVGSLNLERALRSGEKAFEPGLLARANRGFLYIDEVNLLEDHLVDLLLDVAASGENVVERDGLSIRHPARFLLVGSGNPEEGELRPQFLDRFGLAIDVRTPTELDQRVQIVMRRDAYERDPAGFVAEWQDENAAIRGRVVEARGRIASVATPPQTVELAARLCIALGTDGLRAELVLIRTARALAALDDAAGIGIAHLQEAARMALRHRLRRDPLDSGDGSARVERAIAEILE